MAGPWTNQLVVNYGLYKHLKIYRPHVASAEEMANFHSAEYVDFLKKVTPDNHRQWPDWCAHRIDGVCRHPVVIG